MRESLRSLADFLAEDVDAALWVVLYALPHHLYVLGMEIISDVGARTVLAYAAISVDAAHPGTDHQQGHHEDHEQEEYSEDHLPCVGERPGLF